MTAALTPHQHEVARLYAAGLRPADIARRLQIHNNTMHKHLRSARERLGVRERREIAVALQECEIDRGPYGGQRSAHGFRPGDPVEITGGRFEGFRGAYHGHNNSRQVRVRINGGVFSLATKYVNKIEEGR